MAKKKQQTEIKFAVKVSYGFLPKLKIVLLGEVLTKGNVEDGMLVQIRMPSGEPFGTWEIWEVLHMDFINQHENPNFKGLMLKCKSEEEFKLLQSLRVYDETITILKKNN